MMSVGGACFQKDQAALSVPFPSESPSPTPSLRRMVGLDTGGHAGEGGSICEAGVRLQLTY